MRIVFQGVNLFFSLPFPFQLPAFTFTFSVTLTVSVTITGLYRCHFCFIKKKFYSPAVTWLPVASVEIQAPLFFLPVCSGGKKNDNE